METILVMCAKQKDMAREINKTLEALSYDKIPHVYRMQNASIELLDESGCVKVRYVYKTIDMSVEKFKGQQYNGLIYTNWLAKENISEEILVEIRSRMVK